MASASDNQLAAKEALDWLEALGVILTDGIKAAALALVAEEAGIAEVVARLMLANNAQTMVDAVATAISTGVIPDAWDRVTKPQLLITTGLKQADPRIAFQASLRSAYSAGRYNRAMKATDEPYFIYRSMRDKRVRPSHQALDGVCLPKSDPFWNDHYPPNGWRCRCKAYSIDDTGVKRLEDAGLKIAREAPDEAMVTYKDKTGKEITLPESVEPGWDFLPGKQPERMAELLDRRLTWLASGQ